jgi:hypothetical protein
VISDAGFFYIPEDESKLYRNLNYDYKLRSVCAMMLLWELCLKLLQHMLGMSKGA